MASETLRIGKMAELTLPAGMSHVSGGGVDGTAGKITGPGIDCTYDLSAFANTLEGRGRAESLTIDGKPARLVRDGPDVIGLHVTDLRRDPMGVTGLTVYCTGPGVARSTTIETMLRGVRLRL